jgi:endonuclease/exonuclease/phosphatase family metal-dependent hydrolase
MSRPFYLIHLLLSLVFILLCSAPSHGAPSQAGTDLRIGFWNIRNFTAHSRNQTELNLIARVITNMDCVAIAELEDVFVLSLLTTELEKLGGSWKATQTAVKNGNTSYSAEYYGFVYRSDKLKKKFWQPKILPEVTCVVPETGTPIRFDREPAYCKFATLDSRLDFTLMAVHIRWDTEKPMAELVANRRAEVRALKDYFIKVRNQDSADNDVLLCGDFNRNVDDSGSLSHLLTNPTMIDTTAPNIPTTIGTTNTYDHFLFQTTLVQEYTGQHGVIKFDEILFNNDDAAASLACSDHRPVWINLRVPNEDDD